MAAEQLSTFRRRLAAAVAVPAALMLALTACSSTETGQAPAAPASADSSASSPAEAAAPELPDSHQAVQAALSELLAANPAPSREDIRGAWVSAGFSPETVEVSQDGTPTGLAVDSIISAAPDGAECLVGEIRSGKLTVTTVPVLANGQCLLGDDR
ncbi:MAG: hypothetical protein ABS910_08340 [Arthrobacter sp.]